MLLFGFAAINTSNNLLYLITSFMMGFMIISGVISYYNIKYLDISFLKAQDFFASEKNTTTFLLKSKKPFPSFLINIFSATFTEKNSLWDKLFMNSDVLEILSIKSIFMLKAYEEKSIELELTFEKRGHHKEVYIYISSDFPFGFAYREIKYKIPCYIYVYPNPKYCKNTSLIQKSERGFVKIQEGSELYQIKNYQNESPKYINWKASAKRQKIMVNEFSDFISKEIILRPQDFDMELEQKLSCMSYIVLEAMKKNEKVGLDWDGYYIPPENTPFHHIKILRFLATV